MAVPADYDPTIPQATDQLSVSQGNLLLNFEALQAWFDINHVDYAQANAGKHYFVEFPIQASAPTTASNEVGLYSATSTYTIQPELIFLKQAGSTAPITTIEFTSAGYSGTGWTRLPSGILLKWGLSASLPLGISAITFPVAATIPVFSAVYTAFITMKSNTNTIANVSGLSTTVLNVNLSTAGSLYYLVIGV